MHQPRPQEVDGGPFGRGRLQRPGDRQHHRSLQEVQRYIKAADQKRLSQQAMQRIGGTDGEQNCLTLENPGDNSVPKPLKLRGA